jgi:CheY-like chemotaxis protein
LGPVIVDLNLPDMSGFEVLRSLRVSKVKTPVLILTGLGLDKETKRVCRRQAVASRECDEVWVGSNTHCFRRFQDGPKDLLAGLSHAEGAGPSDRIGFVGSWW